MKVINAYSADDALVKGTLALRQTGISRNSRNGPVLEVPVPVTTVYHEPMKRVSTMAARDGNPFFHLFETLWMLGGRNDLASLTLFNTGMARYSDDGQYVRGSAYGARWRHWFHFDQIQDAIRKLSEDPDTRRVVLSQWDPVTDPVVASRDIPCNTQMYLYRRPDNQLDLTVCNRSNDAIYGAYGSNVVHFSTTLEYIARAVGVRIGQYYQVSNSLHAYTENEVWQRVSQYVGENESALLEQYAPKMRSVPLFYSPENRADFDKDNQLMLDLIRYYATAEYSGGSIIAELQSKVWSTEFFDVVVCPMLITWFTWKYTGRATPALEAMTAENHTIDWINAAELWLKRRKSQ